MQLKNKHKYYFNTVCIIKVNIPHIPFLGTVSADRSSVLSTAVRYSQSGACWCSSLPNLDAVNLKAFGQLLRKNAIIINL